jgi:hypothetical protein
MPNCPLYLKGISVAAGPESSIEITSQDPDAVEPIRERAKTHVAQ